MGYVISPTYHFRDASPNTHDISLGLNLLQDGRHLVWAGHCYGDFGLTYSPVLGVRGDWRSFFFVFEGSEPNMLFSGNRWKRQDFFSKRRDGDSHDASITAQTVHSNLRWPSPGNFMTARWPLEIANAFFFFRWPSFDVLIADDIPIFAHLYQWPIGGRSDTLRFPEIGVPPNHPF